MNKNRISGLCIIILIVLSINSFGLLYIDDTQVEFDQGVYANTSWSINHIKIDTGKSLGTYASNIFDSGSNASWGNISWFKETVGFSNYPLISAYHLDANISGVFIKDDIFY